jgi:hypothetical protein
VVKILDGSDDPLSFYGYITKYTVMLTCDFNNSEMERRIAKIGNYEFDVSEMPTNVFLFFNRRTAERRKEGMFLLAEDYYDGILMWFQSIKGSDIITTEWMDEHVSGPKLQQIALAIVNPSMDPPKKIFEDPSKTPKGGKSRITKTV